MTSVFVKCTECNFVRHVQVKDGKFLDSAGDAVLKHAYSKGHILQIGSSKYKSASENTLTVCEDLKEEKE